MILSVSLVSELLHLNEFDFGKEQNAPYSFTSPLSQFLHPTNLPFSQDAVQCHMHLACTSSYVHNLYAKMILCFVDFLSDNIP